MFNEERKWKRFGKNVGRHIRSRYPVCTKSTIGNMVANEVMPNINVFGPGSNGRAIGESAGALIVGDKWKRSGDRKRIECQEQTDP